MKFLIICLIFLSATIEAKLKIEISQGSKDLAKPNAINGKVIEFGIMKCFRSIKNMTINDKLNIINNTEVNVIP